ncbi:MAG: hypothetical protein HYY51_00795 [Candidatus Magasanikbacteria bacterium]|nr:hypothetical protein [Candidatus Magasanikbacteria bacterium]
MHVSFLLQRNFAYVGHQLVRLLKDTYGVEKFSAYVSQRRSYDFLKSQKEINYSILLLDEDVHERYKTENLDPAYLDKLEKDYGIPFLWHFLALDRVLMFNQLVREYPHHTPRFSHEEMLRMIQVHAKAIIEFLEKEKPDAICFSLVSNLGSSLLYHIAKKKGIRTLLIHPTTIKHTYIVSDQYDSFTGVSDVFEHRKKHEIHDKHTERAQRFLQEFRDKPEPYYTTASPKTQPVSRKDQMGFLKPSRILRNSKLLASYFYNHYSKPDRKDYDYISPWNYLRDSAKRKLRNLRGINGLYDTVDLSEDFVFFPLQYEPEITTMLYAPYFADQLNLARQIAKSIPVRYKLYIKEHPAMVVYRPRRFYEELKKIPNVKLVQPNIMSFDLTRKAKLITTITSTAGWEASLLKKPVISFGTVFYNQLSFVRQCKALEELPRLVKEQLEAFSFDETELLHFLSALFEESATVNLQYIWEEEQDMEKKKEGLTALAALIAKKLGL